MNWEQQKENHRQFTNQPQAPFHRQGFAPQPHPHVEVVIPSGPSHPAPQAGANDLPPQTLRKLHYDGAPDLQFNRPTPVSSNQTKRSDEPYPNRSQVQVSSHVPPAQEASGELDHLVLLLSLADEYLRVAHSPDTLQAISKEEADLNLYYKLVATALGCIESAMKHWRLPPLREAQIILRYAEVLYEETENERDAETILSKGIELCDRNKLLDLKYNMQLLLARVLYRSNPKAALKAIDGMVDDAETYKHIAYVYAFRFQRANLSVYSQSHQDFLHAIQELDKTGELARKQGDYAVYAFASILAGLVHLQGSRQDSIASAQASLAAARSLQLNPDIAGNPQMQILMELLDLCCSLQDVNIEQIKQNMQKMQSTMDRIVEDAAWQEDGSINLPLAMRSMNGLPVVENGLISKSNNRPVLRLSWLPKNDIYAIGYLLSAVSGAPKNVPGGYKAEMFLEEGLRLIRTSMQSADVPGSLAASAATNNWRKLLECQSLVEKAFMLCTRSEWAGARSVLEEIDLLSHALGSAYPRDLRSIARYLDGAIRQGTGDLDAALSIFRSPLLSISPASSKPSRKDTVRDFSLLAALNTILIIHSPSHPSHALLQPLLATIAPYLSPPYTPHPLLRSAFSLVLSIPTTSSSHSNDPSILRTKQHLGAALNIARTIVNNQIVSVALAMMTDKFFRGVVGEQAEKSARAAAAMARKSTSTLWTSVADGLLSDTLEIQGKREEALRVRKDAERVAGQLPVGIQKRV